MSQRREKKIRRQMREGICTSCLAYISCWEEWAASEPPAWRIFDWRRWMRNRPWRKM